MKEKTATFYDFCFALTLRVDINIDGCKRVAHQTCNRTFVLFLLA